MINKQFPSAYDVEQTIKFHTTQYHDAKRFYQSFGLLNVGSGKDHLSSIASNILLEHNDYIKLRQIAQGASPATNISGFSIRSKLVPKTTQNIIEDLISLREKLIEQEGKLKKMGAPIQKLEMPKLHNGSIFAKFEYQRTILGRVELIQIVDTDIEFMIEPFDKNTWRVVCFPDANQDIRKIETLFQKLDSGAYEPFIISLEDFTQKQRIQFFDDVIDYYSQKSEWQVQEVTEISIRQEVNRENFVLIDPEELENEDEIKDAEESDLQSISQAVLQGQRLRTNSFVKECEHHGFYFPAMTLSLQNRNTPELIQVMIRFKLSPKIFEVILISMGERNEIGDIPVVLEYNRQQEILREFWNTSHVIWQELFQQVPQQTGLRQLPLVEAL